MKKSIFHKMRENWRYIIKMIDENTNILYNKRVQKNQEQK